MALVIVLVLKAVTECILAPNELSSSIVFITGGLAQRVLIMKEGAAIAQRKMLL